MALLPFHSKKHRKIAIKVFSNSPVREGFNPRPPSTAVGSTFCPSNLALSNWPFGERIIFNFKFFPPPDTSLWLHRRSMLNVFARRGRAEREEGEWRWRWPSSGQVLLPTCLVGTLSSPHQLGVDHNHTLLTTKCSLYSPKWQGLLAMVHMALMKHGGKIFESQVWLIRSRILFEIKHFCSLAGEEASISWER